MTRKLTSFVFYKNTPLTDLKNTIYFKSNFERDNFFNTHYEKLEVEQPFNFIRDRMTLNLRADFKDIKNVNYCRFTSEFDNISYYAFIPEFRYINDNVIEITLMIDVFMTFCQGDVLDSQYNISVKRQHLTNEKYKEYLPYLKNNDDVIKTYTKKYFNKEVAKFKDFNILIHSTCNLFKEFGDVNNPKISTSTGTTFDGISSPVDLYLIKEKDFQKVMDRLSDYAWITQNFIKIVLIPNEILNLDMTYVLSKQVSNPDVDLSDVYKINGGETSVYKNFLKELNKSNEELLELYDLDLNNQHLLRNEYCTLELYNYSGQQINVDVGLLPTMVGLQLPSISVAGYNNELAIYIRQYNSNNYDISTFLNDSILFNDFDDIPILVDNYNLAMSKSANQRKLTESNLLTGKVNRIVDSDNNIQDRMVSAVSILSNLSPMSIGKGLVDEHEFYRQQKAQELDLQLSSPTVTNITTNNSLNRKHNFYGVTMLMSKIDKKELNKIKKYYNLYGFSIEESNSKLDDTRSMSICNYIEIEGNLVIEDIERSLLDILEIQLENGIRLWHNNNMDNPFLQNVLYNERVK